MEEVAKVYRAYLMRLWIMDNDGCPVWCLSLEETEGANTIYFTGIADFLVFIIGLIEDENAGADK